MTAPVSVERVRVIPGTIDGMKTTIDSAGRVVIPKELRESLCLNGGDEVEITLADERLELVPAPRPARLRRGPHGLLTSDLKAPEYGPEEVREALERTRQWPR
jgi:AbrB family looped-hinge helix DNA binding protein